MPQGKCFAQRNLLVVKFFHFGAQGQHDMKCCLKYLAEEKRVECSINILANFITH